MFITTCIAMKSIIGLLTFNSVYGKGKSEKLSILFTTNISLSL